MRHEIRRRSGDSTAILFHKWPMRIDLTTTEKRICRLSDAREQATRMTELGKSSKIMSGVVEMTGSERTAGKQREWSCRRRPHQRPSNPPHVETWTN